MKAIELFRPHAFLVWKNKQTSIANDLPLSLNEPLGIVCDGELYGEVVLNESKQVDIESFDKDETHCIRQYERKLNWPQSESLFVHTIKELNAYDEMVPCHIENGEVVLDEIIEPTEKQQHILDVAKDLPNQILIDKEFVGLTDDYQIVGDNESIKQLFDAAFGEDVKNYETKTDVILPLYHLALVRVPVLRFRENTKMPYEIIERDDEYCVVNSETDEIEECYDNEPEADALLTALQINVDEESKQWDGSPTNYDTTEQYCNACLIDLNSAAGQEEKTQKYCMLPVKSAGSDAINPEGLQAAAGGRGISRIEKPDGVSQDDFDKAKTTAANTIISNYPKLLNRNAPDSIYKIAGKTPPEKSQKAGRRIKGEWLKKLKEHYNTLKELITWAEKEDETPFVLDGFSGYGIKESKDGDIFYTYAANAFEDREGEIFSTKALQDYVEENSDNEIKGYFNLFHMTGTDFAEKRFQGVVGRFLLEAGPFMNTELAKQVKKFLKQYPKSHPDIAPEGWGASVEYKYLPEQRQKGIYEWVWITRTSLLPRAAAANINTSGGIKMSDKNLTPAQIEVGKNMLGDELFDKLVEEGLVKTAKLEKEMNFKDVENDEVENEEVEPVETENPVEPVESETEESVEESVDESVEETPVETVNVEEVKSVVMQLQEGMKAELEIIAHIPEAMESMSNRIDELEKQFAVKQVNEQPRFSFFNHVKQESVTSKEEGDLTADDVKGPKETKPKGHDSYGGAHFAINRS